MLWLGELRQYADTAGGTEVLGRLADLLTGEGHLLITTVWPEHWDTYTAAARTGPGAADPAGIVGRLLDGLPKLTGRDLARLKPARGGVIDVPPEFTETDLQAAGRTGDLVALRASFAPIRSLELGVPESLLSIDSRRSSSATRSSSRRSASWAAFCADRSTAISASFASTTARSRAFAARSPAASSGTGSSDTREDCHASPRDANKRTPDPEGVARRHQP